MSSINARTTLPPPRTAEGGIAARITPLQELIRTTMSCMLWENGFYEAGQSVADRIKTLVHQVTLREAAGVAIEARNNMKLRHVPLLIVREMARHPKRHSNVNHLLEQDGLDYNHTSWVSKTLAEVIQRPDELTEFLAIYWKDGKQPLSKQVKLGLAKAFQKFNEYSLAKYNRKKDVMLRDVLFLCHSKPKDVPAEVVAWDKKTRAEYARVQTARFLNNIRPNGFSEGEHLYGKLIYDQLNIPDTWEVELSQSKDKRASWARLLNENKLGDMAFIRNLRNMMEAGIPPHEIRRAAESRAWGRVLPFRFISAARTNPTIEPTIEQWMLKCLDGAEKLPGKTVLLCDVSSSMEAQLSSKSDLTRADAMRALAILLREICEDVVIIPFAQHPLPPVAPRRGFALADIINRGGARDGTYLGVAVQHVNDTLSGADRLIVLTDEQTTDRVPAPKIAGHSYMINVAANKNGVGYGSWLHIDGFSEAITDYIRAYERSIYA